MNISFEPADLQRDRQILIETLREYLTPTSNENRFDWLYHGNPCGPPRAWLARETETGEIVGASAAFPRRAIVNGAEKSGWVLGDFCVASKFRSLGPALHLQRATLSAVAELPGSDFCYDFPSQQLTAIYRRIGVKPAGAMVRLAKPLRLDGRFMKLGWFRRPAVGMANLLLRLLDYRPRATRGWEVAIHQGNCGKEFTDVIERARRPQGFEIQRSAEYLNWRYLLHPFFKHQILTARRAGELHGYLIFNVDGDHAQIVDWCVEDEGVLRALVLDLSRRLRRIGALTLSTYLLEGDTRLDSVKKIGFWPREKSPVVVNWPAENVVLASTWFLMYGDRDS